LNRIAILSIAAGLALGQLAVGQTQAEKKPAAAAAQPANELANAMAQRLGNELHLKTAVGEPIKVGSVTLIPIIMVDVHFGGGGMAAPGSPAAGADGFYMSGEARPLGFVAITKKGTRFISVGKTPAK
jgi:uncharacterized spore protein YtfJ